MLTSVEEQVRAIRMGLSSAPAFAVVEGPSDKALFKRLLDPSVVIVIAGGKEPLYEMARQVARYPSVLAFADQDYDLVLGRSIPTNVLHWDHADAETTCVLTGGFEYIIDSYCSVTKVEAFGQQLSGSLRAALLQRLSTVGALRLVMHATISSCRSPQCLSAALSTRPLSKSMSNVGLEPSWPRLTFPRLSGAGWSQR